MRTTLTLLVPLLLLALARPAAAESAVWTNAAGRAFNARLEALTDTHATFVLEDGTRHMLALTALDPASQATARRQAGLPAIPDVLLATFRVCTQHLRRAAIQREDGRLTDAEYADMRRRILNAFRTFYHRHELPPDNYAALEQRLLAEGQRTSTP